MATTAPPTQITKAETFILDSLSEDDEKDQRLDGKVLYEVPRLQGKKPIYYYFRTQTEHIRFSDIFRQSGYRYLHLSCHGNKSQLLFTFGQTDYDLFASIFEGKLNNRRLFVSGCALANKISNSVLSASNDIGATFNSSVDTGCLGAGTRFYYGFDNATPAGTINLLVVVLHELGMG